MSKKTNENHPKYISLRLTAEERVQLEKAATGMSLSAYVRYRLFDKAVKSRKTRNSFPLKDSESLARALGLLGQSRIANNLNQIAHEANCGSLLMDEETESKINEAYEHVTFMRNELIKALGLLEGKGQ